MLFVLLSCHVFPNDFMQSEKSRYQSIWVCFNVLKILLQDLSELLEFSCVNLFYHILVVLSMIEETSTLALWQQRFEVVEILMEESSKDLLVPKRLHVILLDDSEYFADSTEDRWSIGVKFKGFHLFLIIQVLASLCEPVILPSTPLLEMPVLQILPRQFKFTQWTTNADKDVENLIKDFVAYTISWLFFLRLNRRVLLTIPFKRRLFVSHLTHFIFVT